jgi:hypothetical protein
MPVIVFTPLEYDHVCISYVHSGCYLLLCYRKTVLEGDDMKTVCLTTEQYDEYIANSANSPTGEWRPLGSDIYCVEGSFYSSTSDEEVEVITF